MSNGVKAAGVAWRTTAVYYFHRYTLRSARAVMMKETGPAARPPAPAALRGNP